MLRLAFDFIITWRETRTRPNAYYYSNLPNATHPKTEFINEVIKKTGVSFTAVRNWVVYGMKPNNPEHIAALSEITGISPENLWSD